MYYVHMIFLGPAQTMHLCMARAPLDMHFTKSNQFSSFQLSQKKWVVPAF